MDSATDTTVAEIETAGPRQWWVHQHKTKLMIGLIHETAKLDMHEFNLLQRNSMLPTVWISLTD